MSGEIVLLAAFVLSATGTASGSSCSFSDLPMKDSKNKVVIMYFENIPSAMCNSLRISIISREPTAVKVEGSD